MDHKSFNTGLFDLLAQAPTAFHACRYVTDLLCKQGFTKLSEQDVWTLEAGKRYVVTRNDAALIAFVWTGHDPADTGFRMVGAHTDSPALKVKPRPESPGSSFIRLGVEVYGGPILSTWFDRELSLAGRISAVEDTQGQNPRLIHALVDAKDPVAVIPNLAIHLDREVNNGKAVNKQNDLPPLLMLETENAFDFRAWIMDTLVRTDKPVPDTALVDFDLMLYDPNGPVFTGLNKDFITGGRLDNLVSCYCGARALLDHDSNAPALVVFNDHEEVGSVSTSGAAGNFLSSVLQRLCPSPEACARARSRSFMISSDNAHGIHPNYKDRYEPNHGPVLNKGPVIKYNANQRYATDSRTGAMFRYLCAKAGVPFQEFVVRSDMPCGSTIGPLTAGETGIRTLDAGIPMLAMHSIRETAGAMDAFLLYSVLKQHLETRIEEVG